MSRKFANFCVLPVFVFTLIFSTTALAQFIDFETVPGGGGTVDLQTISDQYAPFGVTFSLLDRATGLPIGFPRIAKTGLPQTAFEGCFAADTPRQHLDQGTSMLTDGTDLGVQGDLLIEYSTPVAGASGVVLDIDCRVNGGAPCEQWTITAYDASGQELQSVVLDAPTGDPNPECASPQAGPGDSEAFGWNLSTAEPLIKSIIMRYTGEASNVGLAFDNFSVAGLPGLPEVAVSSPAGAICPGETINLSLQVSGGLPPYSFQWQFQTGTSGWLDLGSDPVQSVQPLATTFYRVVVTDGLSGQVVSNVVEVAANTGDPLCAAALLVASNTNSSVIRYSFRSLIPQIFVNSASGGLDGSSSLVCGNDGNLYISSQNNDRVLRFDGTTGAFQDIFVSAGSGGLDVPVGLDFGPDGNLYVASYNTHAVLRFDGITGVFIDAFVPTGSGLNGPTGLIFGPDHNLYVSSYGSDKVLRFDGATGAYLGDFVAAGSGGLDQPRGLTFGPDDNLYVAEETHDSVRRYDGATGAFIDVFVPTGTGGLDRANDVVFGPDGILYVASFNSDQVLRFDGISGEFLGTLPTGPLDGPAWFAVGCRPIASATPDNRIPALGLQVGPGVPNPFNPRTTVSFTLAQAGHTRATVIDLSGRVVATILDRGLEKGTHTVNWDGRLPDGLAAPSGGYFLRVESGGRSEAVKMLLLR